MQRDEFKNAHVLKHFDSVREVTNNLIFMYTTRAEQQDKDFKFNKQAAISMGWPSHIKSMYDYRNMYGVFYGRLFQFCIISLCSDIEFFFKETFEVYNYPSKGGNGFFQRLDDVLNEFKLIGIDFSSIENAVNKMRLAFQVRHIGIHNMGVVDEGFVKKTGLGVIGSVYLIDQDGYRGMYESYTTFLKYLDDKLPAVPASTCKTI